MSKTFIDFTLGADPEFGVAGNDGRIISGANYVRDDDRDAPMGLDGNGVTLELRPKPSINPLEIVSNIRAILKNQVKNNSKFLDLKWIAGSYYNRYPFGGHIHFGGEHILRHIGHNDASAILDQYLGAVSILIEDREEGYARRRHAGYGGKCNWRPQRWGFEYRVPSSWLVSPYVAASMLCLAKTVMHEAVNNPTFPFGNYADDATFTEMRTVALRDTHFASIWSDIKKMQLYQQHKPYLDLIYFLINNKLTWLPKRGMKEAWGIANEEMEAPSNLALDVIWLRHFQTAQAPGRVAEPAANRVPQVGVQLPAGEALPGIIGGGMVSGVYWNVGPRDNNAADVDHIRPRLAPEIANPVVR